MALPTETGRCQVSLDLTMWELGKSLTRLFKCILDTLMQHFYFDDWDCGCLGSATAALVKRELHTRSPSEQQDGRESSEAQGTLPRVCKLEGGR